MKNLLLFSFLICSFIISKVEASGWTKFYGSWSDDDKSESLSLSPLLRLEIKRHERGNQNYVDIEAYSLNGEDRRDIFAKRDQNLENFNKESISLGQGYNGNVVDINLDGSSNILSINKISLDHNFDIVTNMRLQVIDSILSSKQVRLFSEYEFINPERIQGKPHIVMDDRSLLKKILYDHIESNPQLLHSSINRDIVVFLGNTGSGKSTLINYLANKSLTVNQLNKIILSNPSDPSAMKIGAGANSETLLPKFINVGDLMIYDFPGFGDTRGTSASLVNACFIKNIIEGARAVRLIFIAGRDEVTAGRGNCIKKLFGIIENLLPRSQIAECSSLVITKSEVDEEENVFIETLKSDTERGILDKWLDQKRLTRMLKPFKKQINPNDRQNILMMIRQTPSKNISKVNIEAIYNHSNFDYLIKVYREEINEIFFKLREEKFKRESLSSIDVKLLTKMKEDLQIDFFFKNLTERLKKSPLINLLTPISDDIYTKAWHLAQRELVLDLRKTEDIIDEEIDKRKKNLLLSPKEFSKTLYLISDISDLLKKSQARLAHKKSWAQEVLSEVCNRNYLSIRKWLDGILSSKSTLNENDLTYIIPEVFGPNCESWVFYSNPILYKLVFEKVENATSGSNCITFLGYNPIEPEKNILTKIETIFKYTQYTAETKRALDLDRGYQALFEQERQLERRSENCERTYDKAIENLDKEKDRREKAAENKKESVYKSAKKTRRKSGDSDRAYEVYHRRTDQADEEYDRTEDQISSWYEVEERRINQAREDEKARIEIEQKNINLRKEQYEEETYPQTTTIHPKEKQIEDIIVSIIKPNFNINSFIRCIEFEDKEEEGLNTTPAPQSNPSHISSPQGTSQQPFLGQSYHIPHHSSNEDDDDLI